MLVGKPKGTDHYGHLCLGGSIILKYCEGVDWIVMTPDRFQNHSVMTRSGSIQVPKRRSIYWLDEQLDVFLRTVVLECEWKLPGWTRRVFSHTVCKAKTRVVRDQGVRTIHRGTEELELCSEGSLVMEWAHSAVRIDGISRYVIRWI